MEIVRHRLNAHWLLDPPPATAADVVRWMCATQAQDYGGARWAVAQRGQGLTAADVDVALAEGLVVRTHVLRPTWHLVTAADLRWLLQLTAPRVKALAAYGNRQSGLDAGTIATSNRVLAAALQGRQLTRVEIESELRRAGVLPPDAIATGRLLLAAELEGVICSGALRGRQHTHALLDERVPPTAAKDREAAVAELAARYFTSHGPATTRDFAWWSGLSLADARTGAHTAQPALESIDAGAHTYWFAPGTGVSGRPASPTVHLLPNFDEYTVGYTDRSLLLHGTAPPVRPDAILSNVVVVDGRVAGSWKRQVRARSVSVSVTMLAPSRRREELAITRAAQRYASVPRSAAGALPRSYEP